MGRVSCEAERLATTLNADLSILANMSRCHLEQELLSSYIVLFFSFGEESSTENETELQWTFLESAVRSQHMMNSMQDNYSADCRAFTSERLCL